MMDDATTNAFVSLTFDSGSMNWACTGTSATTSNVRLKSEVNLRPLLEADDCVA